MSLHTAAPPRTEDELVRIPEREWLLEAIETRPAAMWLAEDTDSDHFACPGCAVQPWRGAIRPAVQLTFGYRGCTWMADLCPPHAKRVEGQIEIGWTSLADLRGLVNARRS